MFRKSGNARQPNAVGDAERLLFERNARIFASDGPVGSLRQVVIDEQTGEITMLVVTPEDSTPPILVPANLLHRSAGSAIFLSINRSQFARAAARAARFDMAGYKAARVKQAISNVGNRGASHLPLLGSAGSDLVEAIQPHQDAIAPARSNRVPASDIAAPAIAPLAIPASPVDQPAPSRGKPSRRLMPIRLPRRRQPDDIAPASGE